MLNNELQAARLSFIIHHLTFTIHHSAFIIPRSAFIIFAEMCSDVRGRAPDDGGDGFGEFLRRDGLGEM
jgi:hypothetical protein